MFSLYKKEIILTILREEKLSDRLQEETMVLAWKYRELEIVKYILDNCKPSLHRDKLPAFKSICYHQECELAQLLLEGKIFKPDVLHSFKRDILPSLIESGKERIVNCLEKFILK